ncbi:MAG: recombinase family protein [Pseudomonadota bacterium]
MSRSPRRLGYIRVSTRSQAPDRQVDALRAECDTLHIEHVSAVADDRPVFDEVMQRLQPGDTFVVMDLDRAFRSSVDAMLIAADLRAHHVAFRILSLQVDTTTPEGELFYTLLAAFAQFERRIISRRTREGLAAARERGQRLGRPPILTAEQVADAYRAVSEAGRPSASVAAEIGVGRTTLERAFHDGGYAYPVPHKPKGGSNA